MFRPNVSDKALLVGWILVGLAIRMYYSWISPLSGDEVGTWIYMGKDYRYILTHFIDPWLSMGPFIAVTKAWSSLVGDHHFLLRIPVVVAGSLCIPFVAGTARMLGGGRASYHAAGLLVALNPYLILFSANLRSYAVILLTTCAALYFLLRWLQRPGWLAGSACALSCSLSIIYHTCTAYYICFLGFVFVVQWIAQDHRWQIIPALRTSASLWLPMLLLFIPAIPVYLPILDDMVRYKSTWGGASPTPVDYLAYMTGAFFGKGWLAIPWLVLLLWGWMYATRRNPACAWVVGSGVVIPMILYAASGSQHFPWGSVRFLIYLLPLLLAHISTSLFAMVKRPGLSWAIFLLLVATWWPALIEAKQKQDDHPWITIHQRLREYVRDEDAILIPGNNRLILMPYMKETPWMLTSGSTYLAGEALSTGSTQHLVVIIADMTRPPSSRHPAARMGDLELLFYSGTNRHEIASDAIRDIQRMFDQGADPVLADVAQECLLLMRAMDWDTREQLQMQEWYYHSFIQSPVGQHMPPRQRELRFP